MCFFSPPTGSVSVAMEEWHLKAIRKPIKWFCGLLQNLVLLLFMCCWNSCDCFLKPASCQPGYWQNGWRFGGLHICLAQCFMKPNVVIALREKHTLYGANIWQKCTQNHRLKCLLGTFKSCIPSKLILWLSISIPFCLLFTSKWKIWWQIVSQVYP